MVAHVSARVVRFVDRTGRRDADRALGEARALTDALALAQAGACAADTPANAAELAHRARAVVTELQVAIRRLDARAEG